MWIKFGMIFFCSIKTLSDELILYLTHKSLVFQRIHKPKKTFFFLHLAFDFL